MGERGGDQPCNMQHHPLGSKNDIMFVAVSSQCSVIWLNIQLGGREGGGGRERE